MKDEYLKLKEYTVQSGKTVAVTGAGISYLFGMRRLKQSAGKMNSRREDTATYVRNLSV